MKNSMSAAETLPPQNGKPLAGVSASGWRRE